VDDPEECRKALEYATQKVGEDPEDGVYWLLKGNCHYRLEELEEAQAAYHRAVELGEVRSHASYYLGSCLVELGRVDEAVDPLLAQLAISPDHLDALFLLGLCYHLLDAREKAHPLLERARDLDTGFYEEMFAKYADLLAKQSDDPLMRRGLQDAARALRRQD
jgi:tetratricopeptide (TPR) repeat protein